MQPGQHHAGRAFLFSAAHDGARFAFPHRGKLIQSAVTLKISEPIATTAAQISGNSSSTATTTALRRRVLFVCAKRQPATPIGHLRLAPSSLSKQAQTREGQKTVCMTQKRPLVRFASN